ncbi:MAG: hypothetical protein LBG07_06430 [Treponema sp.]|jgi:fructosamine-3-kinase|nr:hypothetical protein [Treponema sp.]
MVNMLCKNRTMALTALIAIAENTPPGTQRAVLLAVNEWILQNTSEEYSRVELDGKFAKLFEKTEAEQKGWDWYCRGSRKVGSEWVSTEPEDGAEWKCVWNAKTKRWEPPYQPPLIEKKGEAVKHPVEAQ